MEPGIAALTPARLLADTPWMKRLALTLVREDAGADDIVQSAWLKAAEQPQTAILGTGWLRAVIQNLAYRNGRAAFRRRRRELAAARPQSLNQAPEIVLERAEIQHRIVDSVLRLAEPYRSTVLLRFFEDLTLKEIARRQLVPESTVRSRLRRALDRLRTRLDGIHESRAAWFAVLVPSPALIPATVALPHFVLGGLLVTKTSLVLSGAVVLLIGSLTFWAATSLGPSSADRPVATSPVPDSVSRDRFLELQEELDRNVKRLEAAEARNRILEDEIRGLRKDVPMPADARGQELSGALAWLQRHAPETYSRVTARQLAAMGRVDLSGTSLTAADIETLHPCLALATELDLSRAKLSPELLAELARLENLRKLSLGATGLGNDDLDFLKGMAGLEILNLAGTLVSDRGLSAIAGMASLSEVDLSRLAVTDEGIVALRGLKTLTSITLHGTGVRGEWLAALATLPAFRSLTISEVDRAGLEAISGMRRLESLFLPRTALGDESLRYLSAVPSLRRLIIGDRGLTDAALEHLGRMTDLESLDVRHTKFTAAGMRQIENLRSLKNLTLMNAAFGDAGLARLAALNSLRHLSLIGTPVTDAGATHLQALPLSSLDLRETLVTPAWVAAFRASHPGCDVFR